MRASDSYEQAVAHGHEALAALVEAARQRHEPLPEPRIIARTA